MILFLSGEGPSDIGTDSPRHDSSETNFAPGPMAHIVDQIVESILGYSLVGISAFEFIPESELGRKSRDLGGFVLPGLKQGRETGEFFKNARALAKIATDFFGTHNTDVGAVLFRDCDGTNSSPSTRWQEKWDSMVRGFLAEEFEFGVPMIPKPKSEAWLLCALRVKAGNTCHDLEDLPGNDASENAPKRKLAQVLDERGLAREEFYNQIETRHIDATRVDMPSFKKFKDRMEKVAWNMLRHT